MHLFTFEAVPTVDHPDFDTVEGAYVSAWIPSENLPNREDAEDRARTSIESLGWFIKDLDRYTKLDLDTYEPRDEEQEYFDEALSGEDVLVFYTYPDDSEPDPPGGE